MWLTKSDSRMRFHGNFRLQREVNIELYFVNMICAHGNTKPEQSYSPGALTADQHKVGNEIHSTKTTTFSI